ncbi:MAG: ROK family protein [Bacteriovoracaceae bacterium]|nr:ROK family protein [Bacteriovoracaceae bacterium]
MKNIILGLDIGGTKIEGILLQIEDQSQIKDTMKILARQRVPTNRKRGYLPVMKTICELCTKLLDSQNLKISDIAGIGAGLPGAIHPQKQIMLNGNSSIFINQNFIEDLNNLLPEKTRIVCDNDASCFALAEVISGAGNKYQQMYDIPVSKQVGIGIILGTGVGGGIVIEGKLLRGIHGGGGEIGHTELVTGGNPCYCGHLGCVEQYLSGPGVESMYRAKTYGSELKAVDIFEKANTLQDPICQQIIDEYKLNMIRFLRNLSNIFDPHYFVLGGGVSNQEQLYTLEKSLAKICFNPVSSPNILQHQLGDSAGVIGAALLLEGR